MIQEVIYISLAILSVVIGVRIIVKDIKTKNMIKNVIKRMEQKCIEIERGEIG